MNANEATLLYADEYSRMAEVYDRVVTPRFEPIARAVLELASPGPNELVLDLATGTGLLACLVAPIVNPQTVVAIDLADGALSVASYRAGNAGIRNIRFEMMDARNIVYRGGLFDAVVSNLGIPNLGYDRTFAEVRRVLKAGGRFVFSEWAAELPAAERVFYDLLEEHATRTPSKALAELREARRINREDSDARGLRDPGTVTARLAVAGFAAVEVHTRTFPTVFPSLADLTDFLGAWGWDDRELSEMPPGARKPFDAALADALGPRMGPGGLRETFTIHLYATRA